MPIVRYRYHGLPILSHRRSLPLSTTIHHSPLHPRAPLYLYVVRARPTSSGTITDPPFISLFLSHSSPLLSSFSLHPLRLAPTPAFHPISAANARAVDTTNNLITSHRQCVVSHRSADFHCKGTNNVFPFELSIHS